MVAIDSPVPSMRHLNGSVLLSTDIETTGLDPDCNDILQVAFVVSNNYLEPHRAIPPFYLKLRPSSPHIIDAKAMQINSLSIEDYLKFGIDPYDAAETLVRWIGSLGLAPGKKVQLLGHNVHFDMSFMTKWLGLETVNLLFDYHYRDLASALLYLNDRACLRGIEYPVSKVSLAYICKTLGVVNEQAHDALHDAVATLECYRRLMGQAL